MLATAAGFRLAARFDEVGFSDIVNVRNRVMELRAQGASVYQFEGGEPYRSTPDYIKEAVAVALKENKTRYAPSSGIPELRSAIADKIRNRNRIPAEVENVIVVNGGMQGLFGAFQSVVNPGDEVLVFSPYWTPIRDLVAHCQARIVLVPTAEARRNGLAETLARYAVDARQEFGPAQAAVLSDNMAAHCEYTGSERPHMQIMNGTDTVHTPQLFP